MATASLGRRVLSEARHRLDAWADEYREAGWPALTPAYLLRGYFAMLRAEGDHDRLAAYATDRARHWRMLDMTGGDAEALAEIRIAQDLLRQASRPNLGTLLRLAMHQSELLQRNANLPVHLPSVWAGLGRYVRARSLARAIPSDARRAEALAGLAATNPSGTDRDRMARLLDEAEQAARTVGRLDERAQALAAVAQAMRATGDEAGADRLFNQAVATARRITAPHERAPALVALSAAAKTSDLVNSLLAAAETAAAAVADGYRRVQAVAGVAVGYFSAGQHDYARALLEQAEAADHSVHTSLQPASRSAIGLALIASGELTRAEALLDEIPEPFSRDRTTATLVEAFVENDPERATRLAARIQEPYWQATASTTLARAYMSVGKQNDALTLAGLAEQYTRRIDHEPQEARHIADLAVVIGTVLRDKTRAHALAHEALRRASSIKDPSHLNWIAEALAAAFAAAGDLTTAEQSARMATDGNLEDTALQAIADTLAQLGDLDRAEAFATKASDDRRRSHALTTTLRAALTTHQIDRARRIAQTIPMPESQAAALAEVATAYLSAGEAAAADDTLGAAMGIEQPTPYGDAIVLSAIAGVVARRDRPRAIQLCLSAEQRARQLDQHLELRDVALKAVSRALAEASDPDGAHKVTQALTSKAERARSLAELSQLAHASADPERAAALADEAEQLIGAIVDVGDSSAAIGNLACGAASIGDWVRAERLAKRLTEPVDLTDTFSNLAAVAFDKGKLDKAQRYSAYALVSGAPWSRPLAVLARLQPNALTKIADEIISG